MPRAMTFDATSLRLHELALDTLFHAIVQDAPMLRHCGGGEVIETPEVKARQDETCVRLRMAIEEKR